MAFYDLSKPERDLLTQKISQEIRAELQSARIDDIVSYFSHEDTYIRKAGYLAIGRIYQAEPSLHLRIIDTLDTLLQYEDFKIRQTAINAAGEIGKTDFERVTSFFDKGLLDAHHSVRNAVIGSVKKMGQANPVPVLKWAAKYLHHPDKEIRREICHGIELRGRTHPQDILPMLHELQHDKTARVRNTLVHVLGQIAYKKGCLETVVGHLKTWNNQDLVKKALKEITDVHHRYRDFAVKSHTEAKEYIDREFK